jgi:hypothetical protein
MFITFRSPGAERLASLFEFAEASFPRTPSNPYCGEEAEKVAEFLLGL